VLPNSSDGPREAVRLNWVRTAKDFNSRPDQPAKFGSVVTFENPKGARAEEWLSAKRADVVPNALPLASPAGPRS
ncbi:MAG: hypothetical protein ACLPIX_13055, partial [Rhodomicrobium sp.]